ncbi:MAG: hypothetical protein ACJ8LG_06800 [Massilia sp.]
MRPHAPMLAVLLLAPALAGASPAASAVFSLRCEREMKPVFEVSAHLANFQVNNSVSSSVLNTRLLKASASQLALGMTAGTVQSEVMLDGLALLDQGSGLECVSPRISVVLSYNPLQVYVAREFHAQSCSYRAIFEHEMQHVRLYRQHLPLVEQRVREQLAARYRNQPLYAPAGQGLSQLEADVDQWLRPLIREELARIELLQAGLDTPEESFRLSHACLGEVASRVGSSF